MSRLTLVLATGAVAAGMAAAPAVATAQPPANASCAGVLSSFAGQTGIRSDFAPLPGSEVSAIARQHGDLETCALLLGG